MITLNSCSKCHNYVGPEFSDGMHCPSCKAILSGLDGARKKQRWGVVMLASFFIFGGLGQMLGGNAGAICGMVLGLITPFLFPWLHEKKLLKINKNQIFLLSSILLFIAVLPFPVNYVSRLYYNLLRLVICVTGGYGAYLSYKKKDKKWVWTLAVIAVLFNPIRKFYLGKMIYIIAAVISFVYFKMNCKKGKK